MCQISEICMCTLKLLSQQFCFYGDAEELYDEHDGIFIVEIARE